MAKNLQSTVDPIVLPQSPPTQSKGDFRSPKNKLQELCQSMKFPLPNYQHQISEDGFVIVKVSIMIVERQEVQYSYTSEQAISTKKYIKQCEENVAEIAFAALTEQYGTCMPSDHTSSQFGKHYIHACVLYLYTIM